MSVKCRTHDCWTEVLPFLQTAFCNLHGFLCLAGVSDTAERGLALWPLSFSAVQ